GDGVVTGKRDWHACRVEAGTLAGEMPKCQLPSPASYTGSGKSGAPCERKHWMMARIEAWSSCDPPVADPGVPVCERPHAAADAARSASASATPAALAPRTSRVLRRCEAFIE